MSFAVRSWFFSEGVKIQRSRPPLEAQRSAIQRFQGSIARSTPSTVAALL